MSKKICLSFVVTLLIFVFNVSAANKPVRIVRVGITEYQNIESVYKKYSELFQELTDAAGDEPVSFQFALGTSDEMVDWYNRRLIDVAIFTTLPITDLLSGNSDILKDDAYVGNLANVPNYSTSLLPAFADELGKQRADPKSDKAFFYRTGLFISKKVKDEITPESDRDVTFDDIKILYETGKLRFLFVRPVSVSGYILPKYFLRSKGIEITPGETDDPSILKPPNIFSYSHQNSLKILLKEDESKPEKYTAAFVQDEADLEKVFPNQPIDIKKFYKVKGTNEIDAENMMIPYQVVFVNHHLREEKLTDTQCDEFKLVKYCTKLDEYKILMQSLFKNRADFLANHPEIVPSKFIYKDNSDHWRQNFDEAKKWLKDAELPKNILSKSSFEDFLNDLLIYRKGSSDKTKEPNLALVLSGGGAKCAYQAGAIIGLEKKLKEFNENHQNDKNFSPLKINLVVGTSGGAINTLLTSLMLTADEQTVKDLSEIWTGFQQSDFFQPPFKLTLLFGLSFGLLQALAILFFVLVFGDRQINWKPLLLVVIVGFTIQFVFALYGVWSYITFGKALFVEAVIIVVFAIFVFVFKKILSFLSRKLFNNAAVNWWRLAGWLMLLISLAELAISFVNLPQNLPELLNNSGLFHDAWLIIKLSSRLTAPFPFLIGVLMILSGWKFFPPLDARERWVIRMLSFGLLIAAAFFTLNTFVSEESATETSGINREIGNRISDVLIKYLNRKIVSSPDAERLRLSEAVTRLESLKTQDDADEKLKSISQIIIDENLLERNMIITTSRLPVNPDDQRELNKNAVETNTIVSDANDLPQDLYFYNQETPNDSLLSDKRFVPFKENADKLLDVVIGSSTIYPLFPSRPIKNVTYNKDASSPKYNFKVIDGGFIHNSPVDAAKSWGATHIILIEASPKPQDSAPKNFLDNIFVAYQYLFQQAQRMDTLSRGTVEIFELRPTSLCDNQVTNHLCQKDPDPNMGTFDFLSSYLSEAFEKGGKDVTDSRPLFVRVPGPPLFRDLTDYAPAKKK